MQRREFLAGTVATSAMAMVHEAAAQPDAKNAIEFYLVRRYTLTTGPQTKLAEDYFANALIPALARMGFGPIGTFSLSIGPETPAFCTLIPAPSVEPLAVLDLRLAQDSKFMKAAEPFWSAPAIAPAFQRVQSALLQAFDGWPKLVTPAASGLKGKRILQMRTYESPSFAAHVRKVEMFNSGEFDIFINSGCRPVFFSDTLVGSGMPSLTYMLSFTDLAELDAKWEIFRNDPNWKKLSTSPRYSYEAIVSNITNLVLTPLGCSQI